MPSNADEIQSLLTQRRELRDCLLALREGISDLNKTAVRIVDEKLAPTSGPASEVSGEKLPRPDLAAAPKHNTAPVEKITQKTRDIPMLWIIPAVIVALVFIALPVLLFLRTIAEKSFAAEFSAELVILLTGLTGYLWGSTGSLIWLVGRMIRAARRQQFSDHHYRGVGVKSAIGGLVGLTPAVIFFFFGGKSNVMVDIGLGLTAFTGGIIMGAILWLCFDPSKKPVP